MSLIAYRGSLIGFTMRSDSIRHWGTSARWILNYNMLGRWPNSHVGSVQLHGVTPTSGNFYFGIDTVVRQAVVGNAEGAEDAGIGVKLITAPTPRPMCWSGASRT